jgi:hypothetical protein
MTSYEPAPRNNHQPDRSRMNEANEPAQGGDEVKWYVVAGTLLGLGVLGTLVFNGGSLTITPKSLSLKVNCRRQASDRGQATDLPAPSKETRHGGEPCD